MAPISTKESLYGQKRRPEHFGRGWVLINGLQTRCPQKYVSEAIGSATVTPHLRKEFITKLQLKGWTILNCRCYPEHLRIHGYKSFLARE